jgi:hypothetical protein
VRRRDKERPRDGGQQVVEELGVGAVDERDRRDFSTLDAPEERGGID